MRWSFRDCSAGGIWTILLLMFVPPSLGQLCPDSIRNCFLPHGSPGCENTACCEAVCSFNPLCCFVEWDTTCVQDALYLCATHPNCPGRGNCDVVDAPGGGCNDEACCNAVCVDDPSCCDSDWDISCVVMAITICPPFGACCLTLAGYPDTCIDTVTELQCLSYYPYDYYYDTVTWAGPDTSCADTQCTPTGACCFAGVYAFCDDLTEAGCLGYGGGYTGTYQGDGTTCAETFCPGVGACCTIDKLCIDSIGETFCNDNAGINWVEGGTCDPPCSADTNGDDVVNVTDLINVITDWGTNGGANGGDVTRDGIVNVTDLVTVITQWGPCPGPSCSG